MMRKVTTIFNALLPVLYIAAIGLALLINSEDETLFVILGIYLLIGVLFPCLLFIGSTDTSRKFLASSNIWILAGNLLLLCVEIIYWFIVWNETRIAEANGAMGGGLALFLLIVLYIPHWITYLFSRIAAAITCRRALQGISTGNIYALHMLLHLLPFTDLLSALWVYRTVKKEI